MRCPHWAIVTVKGGMVQGIDTSPDYPGGITILDVDTDGNVANVAMPTFNEQTTDEQSALKAIAATYGKEI
jgi:hypothetical protein